MYFYHFLSKKNININVGKKTHGKSILFIIADKRTSVIRKKLVSIADLTI